MELWAIGMVRNEADVIEPVIRHLIAEGVDRVLVADNISEDGTREILDRLAAQLPITVVDDREPAYRQSEKLTALAAQARAGGAEWVVPFDADELWLSPHGSLRDYLSGVDADVIVGGWYQHQPRLWPSTDPFRSMVWRDREPGPNNKIAFRPFEEVTVAMGAHDVQSTVPLRRRVDPLGLQVHHYRFRSFGQMVRKVRQGKRAIELTEMDQGTCWHWRLHGGRNRARLFLTWVRLCSSRRDRVQDRRVPSV